MDSGIHPLSSARPLQESQLIIPGPEAGETGDLELGCRPVRFPELDQSSCVHSDLTLLQILCPKSHPPHTDTHARTTRREDKRRKPSRLFRITNQRKKKKTSEGKHQEYLADSNPMDHSPAMTLRCLPLLQIFQRHCSIVLEKARLDTEDLKKGHRDCPEREREPPISVLPCFLSPLRGSGGGLPEDFPELCPDQAEEARESVQGLVLPFWLELVLGEELREGTPLLRETLLQETIDGDSRRRRNGFLGLSRR